MIRFFRLGDGGFGRFHGTSETAVDLIATVLAYDDARGAHLTSAPHSGYERLAGGETIGIIDTGGPPPIEISGSANGGTLAFEFSSGPHRIVVNCGCGGSGGRSSGAAPISTKFNGSFISSTAIIHPPQRIPV